MKGDIAVKRRWLWISLVFMAGPACVAEDEPELVRRIRPAVVAIRTCDEETAIRWLGNGVFINKKGHLIANYHVLAGAESAFVKTWSGQEYYVGDVLADSIESDLIRAEVDIGDDAIDFIELSEVTAFAREYVYVVTGPSLVGRSFTNANVAAVKETPVAGKVYWLSKSISNLWRGSAVVSANGRLVGIMTPTSIDGRNPGVVISGEDILRMAPRGKGTSLADLRNEVRGLDGRRTDELYLSGMACLRAAEYEKGLRHFKAASEIDPNCGELQFLAGVCLDELEDYAEASERFKKAVEAEPDNAEAYYRLGKGYMQLGRWDEAIKPYKQAVRIKPEHAKAYCGLGSAYLELGRDVEAVEAYQQAVQIKPDYSEAYEWLSLSYSHIQGWAETVEECYRPAAQSRPLDPMAHSGLGWAYFQVGAYHEAMRAASDALLLDPNCSAAHYVLGRSYVRIGDRGAAVEEYEVLKELDKYRADMLLGRINE
jgi:tetratricopeptide (TPR) repeat protein